VLAFQAAEQPVISVDTKKKELIGNFKNPGTDWRAKGRPRRVNGHDFEDKTLGKAIPYGVYDVTDNSGWVSVGITHGPWQRPPGGTPPSSPSIPSGSGSKRWAASAIPPLSG
jgi:hypothetical protein